MPRRAQAEISAQSLNPELFAKSVGFKLDPLGWVLWAFTWMQDGTGLWDEEGPDKWQTGVLLKMGELMEKGVAPGAAVQAAIRIAVASGHGIGKTALVAWIILWFISTRHAPQIVVTANTKLQLTTKTWRELAKWHKMSKVREWFTWTATKFYLKGRDEDWFATAVPWTKEKAQAFAGTHEKHVLLIFDEASTIDDAIWETGDGAMTTIGAMWIAFGNPTKNTGRFKECWGKFSKRWHTIRIDSRTAKKANRVEIDTWIEDYGDDSDFVRIRVKGMFPRAASTQFISQEIIDIASARVLEFQDYCDFPRILSVDVARFGDDESVICRRQGPKLWPFIRYRELDTSQLAFRVIEQINDFDPDACFVDANGVGAGVVDTLTTQNYSPIEVWAGAKPLDELLYFNRRSEMWGLMREWLKKYGSLNMGDLPPDQDLIDELIGIEYGFDNKNRIQMEKKADTKKRLGKSTDMADSLIHGFFLPTVMQEPQHQLTNRLREKARMAAINTSWMAN